MGHAVHFLRRLDRVSESQVELALTLYRDQALLREVLTAADLPAGAERLAISLDDPEVGPFVVVTREGRFVTCLARGMRTSDLPIVTRARLDAASGRIERMRESIGRFRRLLESGGETQLQRAFRLMQQRGPRFTREDAQLFDDMRPLLGRELALHHDYLTRAVAGAVQRVAALRFHRLTDAGERLALAFGDAVWTISHLGLFADFDPPPDASAEQLEHARRFDLVDARRTFHFGTLSHAHRGLWRVARRPTSMLSGLAELEPVPAHGLRLFRELGLATVACAAKEHRAAAIAELGRQGESGTSELEQRIDVLIRTLKPVLLEMPLADPEGCDRDVLAAGRTFAAAALHGTDYPSDAQRADIPDDIARATVASLPQSWLADPTPDVMLHVVSAIPWIARAAAPSLFLPEAWAERILPARGADEVAQWMVPYGAVHGMDLTPSLRRDAPKIGRNESCPCGSGKKHKRCCAGAARDVA